MKKIILFLAIFLFVNVMPLKAPLSTNPPVPAGEDLRKQDQTPKVLPGPPLPTNPPVPAGEDLRKQDQKQKILPGPPLPTNPPVPAGEGVGK